jgi:hypothetical protein
MSWDRAALHQQNDGSDLNDHYSLMATTSKDGSALESTSMQPAPVMNS